MHTSTVKDFWSDILLVKVVRKGKEEMSGIGCLMNLKLKKGNNGEEEEEKKCQFMDLERSKNKNNKNNKKMESGKTEGHF